MMELLVFVSICLVLSTNSGFVYSYLVAHVSPLLVVLLQSHPAVALSADTPWWVSRKALLRCR